MMNSAKFHIWDESLNSDLQGTRYKIAQESKKACVCYTSPILSYLTICNGRNAHLCWHQSLASLIIAKTKVIPLKCLTTLARWLCYQTDSSAEKWQGIRYLWSDSHIQYLHVGSTVHIINSQQMCQWNILYLCIQQVVPLPYSADLLTRRIAMKHGSTSNSYCQLSH